MWKALLVLTLVGLFLGGSLMTLKYTARLGVPRARKRLPRDRSDMRDKHCASSVDGPVTGSDSSVASSKATDDSESDRRDE